MISSCPRRPPRTILLQQLLYLDTALGEKTVCAGKLPREYRTQVRTFRKEGFSVHASGYDTLCLGCEEGTLVRILAACILRAVTGVGIDAQAI